MPTWITHEPALWIGILSAALDLVIAFGVPVSPEQRTAVLGFGAAILAILGAVYVRSQVTPTAKINAVPQAAALLAEADKH